MRYLGEAGVCLCVSICSVGLDIHNTCHSCQLGINIDLSLGIPPPTMFVILIRIRIALLYFDSDPGLDPNFNKLASSLESTKN